MSISAILPSSALSQASNLQNVNQQLRTEFQQLAQALQSGNLTNAKQAFSILAKSASGTGLQGLQLSQEFNALGSTQSANLTGARQAYSSIQQILQSSNPIAAHHHRPHHGEAGSHLLTSGFPDSTGKSTADPSDVFQPVNLSA